VTDAVGPPPRPADSVDLKRVALAELAEDILKDMDVYPNVPTPEQLGFIKTQERKVYKVGVENERGGYKRGIWKKMKGTKTTKNIC
jgi:hypothetical protein